MKLLFVQVVICLAISVVINAEPGLPNNRHVPQNPPLVNRLGRPSSGGRWRRSAAPEPQGSIVLQGQKPMSGPERRPTWNLDYQHNIWQGKNGHVSASGGAVKLPGQKVQPQVGIQGQWRFR